MLSLLKFERVENQTPIDDEVLAIRIGESVTSIRQCRQRGSGVFTRREGAWQADRAGKWWWWRDRKITQ